MFLYASLHCTLVDGLTYAYQNIAFETLRFRFATKCICGRNINKQHDGMYDSFLDAAAIL